jgi:hypothetical protein
MGYFRARRSTWAVGLALFSLGLQILIPLTQALAASYTSNDSLSSRIWICTHYGFKLASTTDADEKAPPAQGGKADCPVCMANAIGMSSLANAFVPGLTVPPVTGTERIVITYTTRAGFEVPSDYLTRAPPVSA